MLRPLKIRSPRKGQLTTRLFSKLGQCGSSRGGASASCARQRLALLIISMVLFATIALTNASLKHNMDPTGGRSMARKVMMQHPQTGVVRPGYFGFSWTFLFFGWWVPLFRGELGAAALHFLFTLITFGLWQVILAFLYNRQFMVRMLEKGYILADTPDTMAAARSALGIATPSP